MFKKMRCYNEFSEIVADVEEEVRVSTLFPEIIADVEEDTRVSTIFPKFSQISKKTDGFHIFGDCQPQIVSTFHRNSSQLHERELEQIWHRTSWQLQAREIRQLWHRFGQNNCII